MKMNLQVKGIKQEKSTDIANLFLNRQEYSTSAIYERVKDNGKEFVRGYFFSAKKQNCNTLPSTEQQEKSAELCTVNNQIDSNEDSSGIIHTYQHSFNSYKIFRICILFLFCTVLILDLFSYFRHIGNENLIQKFKCEKEFYENECDKITIGDGPIINNFCKEKEICMNIQYANVYFHSVVIKYVKEIAMSVTPTTLYSKIFVAVFLIFGLYIIKNI